MIFYSFPYLILTIFYLFLFSLESFSLSAGVRSAIRLVSAAVFIFFFAFSGFIGSDWFNYYQFYADATPLELISHNYDFGFIVLAAFSKVLGLNYQGFKIGLVVIQVLLLHFIICRHTRSAALFYALLIAMAPILLIDTFRNFLSLLFAFQAVRFGGKSFSSSSLFFILLSILFHVSGIVFLVLFFVFSRHINKVIIFVFFIFSLLLYALNINLVSGFADFLVGLGDVTGYFYRYYLYFDDMKSYGYSLGIIEKIFFGFTLLFAYDRILAKDLVHPIFLNSAFIYIFIYLLFPHAEFMINRVSLIFIFGYFFSISALVFCYSKLWIRFSFGFILVSLVLSKTYLSYNFEIYKYNNILFSEEDLSSRESARQNHYSE